MEYENLYTTLVSYGGFTFRKPVQIDDINDIIQAYTLKPSESIEGFATAWQFQPYKLNKQTWGAALVFNRNIEEDSFLLVKICHTAGDGYNLIHFLDTLTDNKSPYIVQELQDSLWDKVAL